MGIVLIFPGGVFLAADGRQSNPIRGNKLISDSVSKIEKIDSKLFIIHLGISQASSVSAKDFAKRYKLNDDPEKLKTKLETSVSIGLHSIIPRLSPDIDIHNPAIKSILLLGGIAQQTSFIAGALYGIDNKSTICETSCYKNIVLGGEELNANTFFNKKCEELIHGQISTDELVQKLINASRDTIRMAEKKDKRIGGKISYAVAQINGPTIFNTIK
jgi:hypothetical protein